MRMIIIIEMYGGIMKKKIIGLMLAFVMVLAACGQSVSKNTNVDSKQEKSAKKINIVASFFPIADLSEKIGGEKVEVKNLIKNGSAHGFEPSVGDMKDIVAADLLIVNGAGFEGWVDKVKASNPELNILDLSEGIDLIQNEDDHDHHDEEAHDHDHEEKEEAHEHDHHEEKEEIHDHTDKDKVEVDEHGHEDEHEGHHHHGPNDPHIWLSLKNLGKMSENIYNKLSEIDSDNKDYYKENLSKVEEKIKELEDKYVVSFDKYKGKSIIVPHEAFAYLVRDLGIEQIALEGINSDSEPTLTKIAEVSELMKEKNITTVFYDYGKTDKAAQTISKETGAKVKPISTLEVIGDEEIKEGKDLFSLMEMNLKNILDSFEEK